MPGECACCVVENFSEASTAEGLGTRKNGETSSQSSRGGSYHVGLSEPSKDLAVSLHEIGINHYKIAVHWRALRRRMMYCLKDYCDCFVERRMERSSWESGKAEIS